MSGRYAFGVEPSGDRVQRFSGAVSVEDAGTDRVGHRASPAAVHTSTFRLSHRRPGPFRDQATFELGRPGQHRQDHAPGWRREIRREINERYLGGFCEMEHVDRVAA